jgi:hypothetical protein
MLRFAAPDPPALGKWGGQRSRTGGNETVQNGGSANTSDPSSRSDCLTAQAGMGRASLRRRNMVQLGIILQYRTRVDACIVAELFASHRFSLGRRSQCKKQRGVIVMFFIGPSPCSGKQCDDNDQINELRYPIREMRCAELDYHQQKLSLPDGAHSSCRERADPSFLPLSISNVLASGRWSFCAMHRQFWASGGTLRVNAVDQITGAAPVVHQTDPAHTH